MRTIGIDQQARSTSAGVSFVERFRQELAAHWLIASAILALAIVLWLFGGMSFWAVIAVYLGVAAVLAARAWQSEPVPQTAEIMPEPQQIETETTEVAAPAKSDTSWRAVVSAMTDPAMVLDATGIIVHHNAAVADLFPRIRVGQPISSVIRSPELLAALDRPGDLGDAAIVELQDRVPVQRRLSAILTRLNLKEPGEGAPDLLVTIRDITDQEKLAQMRADFIAHASHELRTPLASLRGFVETLQGPAKDDAAARERFLKIMAAQAARMTQLIDDLLSLSRIEMRVHLPPRGVVDLNEVVSFVAQSLEPVARAAGIEITLERLPTPARVRGEREELVQVFQNLIHNGIRYGKSGGRVEVRITREGPMRGAPPRISVAVQDNGQGIPPEHLPRLTERFYRISASASREKGGTGLGLAIVKHILTRHRGDLKIASKLGEGSTFTVLLDELPPLPGQA